MNESRSVKTMKVSGGAEYAKVADRLKLFRTEFGGSKTESAYEVDVDGSLVFTVWLWKDKTDLLDLMKAGVTDKDILRSSADANGNAKGSIGSKEKDFEKLESVALGRALAMLGYLASGEIASFEEMEQYNKYREEQIEAEIATAIEQIEQTSNDDELNVVVKAIASVLKYPAVVAAGKKQRQKFADEAPQESPSEDS